MTPPPHRLRKSGGMNAEAILLQIKAVVSGQQSVTALSSATNQLTESTARLTDTYRDTNGRLRDAQGRFAAAGQAAQQAAGGVAGLGTASQGASRGLQGLNAGLLNLQAGLDVARQVVQAVQAIANQVGAYAHQAEGAEQAAKQWLVVLERFNVDAKTAEEAMLSLSQKTGVNVESLKGMAAQYIKMGGTLEDFEKGALAAASSWNDLSVKSITLEDSIANVTTGLAQGRSELMESSGIVVNASQAWEKWAKANDRSVASMSDAEKAHAYAIAVYKEEEIGISTLAERQTDLVKAENQVANAKRETGKLLGQMLLPAYTSYMQTVARAQQLTLEMVRAVKEGESPFAALASRIPALSGPIQTLGAIFNGLKSVFVQVSASAKESFDGVVMPMLQRLAPAAQSMMGAVQPALARIGAVMVDLAALGKRAFEQVLIPAIELLAPIVMQLVQRAAPLFAGLLEIIRNAIAAIIGLWTTVLLPVFQTLAPIVKTAIDAAAKVLTPFVAAFGAFTGAIRAVIEGDWAGAWAKLKETVKNALDAVVNLFKSGGELAKSIAEAGLNLAKQFLAGFLSVTTGIEQAIADGLTNAAANMPQWVKNVVGMVTGALEADAAAGQQAAAALTGTPQGGAPSQNLSLPSGLTPDNLNNSIVAAAFGKTGNEVADTVAGWCARWVRLTLAKAEPNAAKQIEKFFAGNADDVKNRAMSAGKLRKDLANLQPGDAVVYDKNHIGIYIGNGMVRGNNQWGVKNGREVVSNEKLTALGSIAGYVKLSDVIGGPPNTTPAPTSTPTPTPTPKPAPTPTPDAPTPAEIAKKLDAQIKDILAKVDIGVLSKDAANKALGAIREQATTQARGQGAGWQEYAAAAQTAGKALEALQKPSSAAAASFKAQKDVLGDLRRQFEYVGASGLPEYVRSLQALIRQQEKVVTSTQKGSDAQKAAQQVVIDARKALADAQQGKGGAFVTDANLTKYKAQALEVIALEKNLQTSTDAAWRMRATNRIEAFKKLPQEAQNVLTLLKSQDTVEENLSQRSADRAREQAQLRARIAAANRQLSETDARQTLERIQTLNTAELDAFKGKGQERVDMVRRQSQDEFNAKERLAAIQRNNAIRDAENDTSLGAEVRDRRIRQAKDAYTITVTQAKATRQSVVREAQEQAAEESKTAKQEAEARRKEQRDIAARLADEKRQLTVSAAEQTLKRVQDLNRAELADFKGTAAQKAARVKELTELEIAAKLAVARAERDKALRESANKSGPNQAERDRQIRANYAAAERQAGLDRQAAAQAARDAVQRESEAVSGLIEKYTGAREALNKKAQTGTLTADDLSTYARTLAGYWADAGKAGLKAIPQIEAAHKAAKAFGQAAEGIAQGVRLRATLQDIDRDLTAGQFFAQAVDGAEALSRSLDDGTITADAYAEGLDGLADGLQALADAGDETAQALVKGLRDAAEETRRSTRVLLEMQSEANTRIAQEALDLSDKLMDVDEPEEAMNTLQAALERVNAAALDGEDAAAAIDLLIGAINRLANATAINDGFNEFMAGLEGTVSDQIDQITAKIEAITDPLDPMLAKLKAARDELRGELSSTYGADPYASGYVPGADGRGFRPGDDGGVGDAVTNATLLKQRLQDLLLAESVDSADFELTMLEAAEMLASDVGQLLPPSVRKALEDAVAEGDAYRTALADITAEGIADGASEALANVKPQPGNRFDDLMGSLFENAELLRTDSKFGDWMAEQLEKARAEATLTDAELKLLLTTLEELRNGIDLNLLPDPDDVRLEEWNRKLTELQEAYEAGAITAKDFQQQAVEVLPQLDRLAKAAERQGKTDLAQIYRDAAAGLRQLGGAALKSSEQLAEAQKAIEGLNKASSNINTVGGALSKFAGGADEGAIEYATKYMAGGLDIFTKFLSGDIAGMFASIVDWVMNIGDALENLIVPGVKAWKKELREIATLEKEAMGSRKYGGIQNPYYDTLAQDAANREKLADSKWYQRLWWGLTGSGPKVMEDGAAKLKASAAAIFNDLAGSLSNSLTDALMKAWGTGQWEDVGRAFEKSINEFVVRQAITTMLAQSKLQDLIKAYSDARAKAMQDGVITPEEQQALDAQIANLRAEIARLKGEAEGTLSALPGAGEEGAEERAREAAELARSIAEQRLSIEEQQLNLQHTQGLITTEEYERQKLALTIRRIRLEMEAALAAANLTEEQKALIRQQYDLQVQQAEAEAEKSRRDAQDAAHQAAVQQAEALGREREAGLQSWRQSLRGGISALLDGNSPLDALYSDVRNKIAQAIQDGFVAKRILARLDPLFEQLDGAISQGLNPDNIIRAIGAALPALSVEIQTVLGPQFTALNQAIPNLTNAVNGNTKALNEMQFQQTTIVNYATPPSSNLRAKLAGYR